MDILLFILWYIIGVASFVYWWTSENDLTIKEIPMALLIGFGGVIAFFIGMGIHGTSEPIIKKRKKT